MVSALAAVDLAGSFLLRLADGTKVPAKFSSDQEALVTEALRDHESRRLRVKGKAEFLPDGKLKSILSISGLTIHPVGAQDFDPNAPPIWEVVAQIGASAPAEEWAKVPTDLAKNLDHYLYGSAKEGE